MLSPDFKSFGKKNSCLEKMCVFVCELAVGYLPTHHCFLDPEKCGTVTWEWEKAKKCSSGARLLMLHGRGELGCGR